MVSINNNSIIHAIKKYLNEYRLVFYKRGFENFQIIIISMLYMQEIRSIKLLYDKFIKKHWNISLKLIPDGLKKSVTIYLMVDDTLQSKFGTKFDCYSKLFDHTNKNGASYLNGHCFV